MVITVAVTDVTPTMRIITGYFIIANTSSICVTDFFTTACQIFCTKSTTNSGRIIILIANANIVFAMPVSVTTC